ncbi:hypothetical protein B0H19DRAFT_1173107, partial [Mycena capillaripes]
LPTPVHSIFFSRPRIPPAILPWISPPLWRQSPSQLRPKICVSSPSRTHRSVIQYYSSIRTNTTATLQISSSPITALVPRKRKVGSIADLAVPTASSSPT